MMKNYQKIISVGTLFFLSANANGQINDSAKTNSVEEVVVLGSRAGARVKNRNTSCCGCF